MDTRNTEGFALLITLSVLSVVIGLTTIMLGYFNQVREDADTTKALIQADVYYADMVDQLKKLKGKQFAHLYRSPLSLQSEDGRFSLNMYCEPIAKGININWLGFANDIDKQALFTVAQGVFDFIVQRYTIEDADRLLEMLNREIRGGNKYTKKAQSRLRQKNGIITYEQFRDIIKRYEIEADDHAIAKVPWRSYFSFSPSAKKINIDFASPELISYLFDIDLASVKEWAALPKDEKISLRQFIENNGGNYQEKKDLFSTYQGESRCKVGFGMGKEHYRFSFEFIQGEAKYFEFYGKH